MVQDEIFKRIAWLARNDKDGDAVRMLHMHETLVLICHEGIRTTNQSFGSLFAQVDYLCRKLQISVPDTIEIQTARRHSNSHKAIERDDMLYDCRALAVLASAIFGCDIPSYVVPLIPHKGRSKDAARHIDFRHLRVTAHQFAEDSLLYVALDSGDEKLVSIAADHQYLQKIIRHDMVLSLVDVHEAENGVLVPRFIIVEPDYLLDISAIAHIFTDYGHHPLAHLVDRLKPSSNSHAILLGNYAGKMLDDALHGNGSWRETLKHHFADEALNYATCPDLNIEGYKQDCQKQAQNISDIVEELRQQTESDFLVEPTFLCPALGLQGRVDLMTTDMHLLVEQKSGKNFNLANKKKTQHGVYQREDHYVQLLLYFAVLHENFNVPVNKLDIRLMYSKYPLPDGLLVVNYYHTLLLEALKVRNRIAASDLFFAREGFTPRFLKAITPDVLNEKGIHTLFYEKYLLPPLEDAIAPLHSMSPLEAAYFCRMATFLFREQAVSHIGVYEGASNSIADLWNMPMEEKLLTGNAITELKIEHATTTDVTLTFTTDVSLLSFRNGDSVYLYAYDTAETPDITRAILYKCNITSIKAAKISLHLNNPQHLDDKATYCIEHSSMGSANSGLRALHMLMSAPKERRDLLLGQRMPRFDESITLSRNYHPTYDDILLRAKQAQDYYLLVGPPGTGKTSMAMQFLVKEEIGAWGAGAVLLCSYTNRAIDEICEMLDSSGIDFLRIGNQYSCDERFRNRLASVAFTEMGNLNNIRQRIAQVPVVVATTSTLMAHQQILDLKRFTLTIVDEASQILEPNIIGLLSRLGKFILIGDHKQLPAVVQQTERDSHVSDTLLNAIGLTNCRNSLFERLMSYAPYGTLRFCGRMHPEVAAWPNKFFYREEHLLPVPLPHQTEESLDYNMPSQDGLDDMLKRHRMLFIDVRNDNVTPDAKSNGAEARKVADIVARLMRQLGDGFDVHKSIGIIVPYRNQISLIRQEIERIVAERGMQQRLSAAEDGITIDTVERYQGSQRDIIIYSFTISRPSQLEFLTSNTFTVSGKDGDYLVDRKLNVALTRAKKQMIMVGNSQLLSQNALFRELINSCKCEK